MEKIWALKPRGDSRGGFLIEFSLIFDFQWIWEAREAGEARGESGGVFSLNFRRFFKNCIDLH